MKKLIEVVRFLNQKKIDVLVWIIIALILYIAASNSPIHSDNKGIVWIMLFFLIIPTYTNLYLLKKYFYTQKLKYFSYITIAILIINTIEFFLFAYLKLPDSEFLNLLINNIVVIIVSECIYYSRIGLKNLYFNQELKIKNNEYQLVLLQSEIDPNFLAETLKKINECSKNNYKNFSSLLLNLSDVMRYMTQNIENKQIPLEDELNFIKSYIELKTFIEENEAPIELNITGSIKEQKIQPGIILSIIEIFLKEFSITNLNKKIILNLKLIKNSFEMEISSNEKNINYENINNHKEINKIYDRLNLAYPHRYKLKENFNYSSKRIFLFIKL